MICVIEKSTSLIVCSHYVSLIKLISVSLSKQRKCLFCLVKACVGSVTMLVIDKQEFIIMRNLTKI